MQQLGMLMGWLGLLSVLVLLGITWMLIQMSKLSEQLDTLVKRAGRASGQPLGELANHGPSESRRRPFYL